MKSMPFGKFRGVLIEELPFDYLQWLVNRNFLREPLRSAVKTEFEIRTAGAHRDGFSQHPAFLVTGADHEIARRIIESGRRSLAKAEHPDHGGDLAVMQQVNAVADSLLEVLR